MGRFNVGVILGSEMNRRSFLLALSAGACLSPAIAQASNTKTGKRNVLLIAVDDLRPELSCYGNKTVVTPNFDRLAASGVVFNRAYTQITVCMPSRVSLLSGIRPENIGRSGKLTGHLPEAASSLPQYFRDNGYETISIGKIYHHNNDDEAAWSKRYTITFGEGHMCQGYVSGYHLEKNLEVLPNYFNKLDPKENKPRPDCYEIVDKPDNEYPDGKITDAAIAELREHSKTGTPFFLAAGFYRPHLPHTPPKKYWDLYERDALELADNPYRVKGGIGDTDWNELRRYGDIPNAGPVSDAKARQLLHGYYACVSFIDAQIGRLLDELDRQGLRDNTAVVLWGDHGWNLGEHGWWSKNTNYEITTRTVMMASAPGALGGQKTNALCELVDVYPSVCELAGLPLPEHLEGTSFVPLLRDPDRSWKTAAFSVWHGSLTMRTDRYRLTRYDKAVDKKTRWQFPSTGRFELFDHTTDPDENVNLAGRPEYKDLLERLSKQMDAGFRAAKPPKP